MRIEWNSGIRWSALDTLFRGAIIMHSDLTPRRHLESRFPSDSPRASNQFRVHHVSHERSCAVSAHDVLRERPADIEGQITLYETELESLKRVVGKRVKNSSDVDEIVHDVFAAVLAKYGAKPTSELKRLLFASARNAAASYVDRLANRNRSAMLPLDAVKEQLACRNSLNPEQTLLAREAADDLGRAIMSLPPRDRKMLRLHKAEGIKYDAIAEQLDVSPSTVKRRVRLAIEELRRKLNHLQ